jgi:hypothetical protein
MKSVSRRTFLKSLAAAIAVVAAGPAVAASRFGNDNSAYLPWPPSADGVVLRDPSAWYHIVVAVDTTQAKLDDRLKIHINGNRCFSGIQHINELKFVAEETFIDGGSLGADAFGYFDKSGNWNPKNMIDSNLAVIKNLCVSDSAIGKDDFWISECKDRPFLPNDLEKRKTWTMSFWTKVRA